jgi:broad specificity phosphatase PhoE
VSTLYLIRHADAGDRGAWLGDDHLRPLSKKGRRQSNGIATRLRDEGITRLVSSSSLRCVETLNPLADATGLSVETDARLYEGSDGSAALQVADELRSLGDTAALCSHGDVIPDLLSELRILGTTFHHTLTWPKASTWVLVGNGVHWSDAHFVPRPEA